MEQLINKVLSRGTGKKSNLEIKVFGGGKINAALDDVGAKNIEFVREFLANEGYQMSEEDLGGNYARRVMFKPAPAGPSSSASTTPPTPRSPRKNWRWPRAAAVVVAKPVVDDDIELF